MEKIGVSQESVEMLEQDLAGEDNAIRRYKERIRQTGVLGECGLMRALEDMLIQEVEYERDPLFNLGRQRI